MKQSEIKQVVADSIRDEMHRISAKYGDIGRNDTQIAEEMHSLNIRLDSFEKYFKALIDGDSMNDGLGVRMKRLEEQNISDNERLNSLEKKQNMKDLRGGGIAAGVTGIIYTLSELIKQGIIL